MPGDRLRQTLGKQGAYGDEEDFADDAEHEALEDGRYESRKKPDQRIDAKHAQYALHDACEKRRRGVGGKQIARVQGGKGTAR